jgi:heavy metal translocating P-type ATPase
LSETIRAKGVLRVRLTGELGLLVTVTAAVLAGGVLWAAGLPSAAGLIWAAVTVIGLLPAAAWVLRSLWHRQVGVDIIAVLALAGALVVREFLAGAVITLMLATGRALESYAERRAERDLRALLEHAPRSARRSTDTGVELVPVDSIVPDDRLLISPGEVVAVDGRVEEPASLDESVVTGESRVVNRDPGDLVASGVINAGSAFGLRALATARQSTYAGIVRLAEEATRRRAPMVRLADRYAAVFVPFTLLIGGLSWLLTGQLVRAVAVLVVATPCPLILATPIAIVSGLSRSARGGVVVRDGGSLETLGRARTLLVDKTGTLTLGRPSAASVVAPAGTDQDEILRLAASLEQLSQHVLAAAIVREANQRGLKLSTPTDVREEPGIGASGHVEGKHIEVGQLSGPFPPWLRLHQEQVSSSLDSASLSWVRIDGELSAALVMADPVRDDAARTIQRLRDAGFSRVVMLTGDQRQIASQVAEIVGVDDFVAQCGPEEKARRVRDECARAVTVMVGDGINDAPALAEASVGVAIGGQGATASAEVADAVLTVNRLDRLADTVEIARHARRIATQSAVGGMGLALIAMGFAAAGLLPPVAGAFLQEGIDVIVILNALRALRGGISPTAPR